MTQTVITNILRSAHYASRHPADSQPEPNKIVDDGACYYDFLRTSRMRA